MKKILVLSVAAILLVILAAIFLLRDYCPPNAFCGSVKTLPLPLTPSASNPITSTEDVIVLSGEKFGMKISVFNPTSEVLNTSPNVYCDAINISIETSTHLIQPGNYSTFVVVGTLPVNIKPTKYLCQVVVRELTTPQNNFILDVQNSK